MTESCIGCGFCCVRSPCQGFLLTMPIGTFTWETWKGCPELIFERGRYWCRKWEEFRYENDRCYLPWNSWRVAFLGETMDPERLRG